MADTPELNFQTIICLIVIVWSFMYIYDSLTAKDMIIELLLMGAFTLGVLGLFKKLW